MPKMPTLTAISQPIQNEPAPINAETRTPTKNRINDNIDRIYTPLSTKTPGVRRTVSTTGTPKPLPINPLNLTISSHHLLI